MKRNILFFVFIIFIGFNTSFAQNFSFGAKFTPLISWSAPSNSNLYDFTNDGVKMGYGFGPSLKIKLSDSFNTDIGVLFTWQGTKFNQQNNLDNPILTNFNYDTRIQYLQIPVIFEGKFDVSDNIAVGIDFGVIPAVSLSSEMDVRDLTTSTVVATDVDFNGSLFNFFLSAGAGTYFKLSEGVTLSTVVMYNNGIIDVWYDKSSDEYIKNLILKNHFISLNLGIHIDF